MKKRVNLFSKKKQQQPIPTAYFTLRSYGLLFMCICIFLSIVSGIWFFIVNQKYTALVEDTERLQNQTRANDRIQGNIVFFVNKKEQLKGFLKDDAQFEMYYKLINDVISRSQTGATLINFSLNLQRETSFILGFPDFDSAKDLFAYIETEEFLNNFESLSIRQFSINNPGQVRTNTDFQLYFSGILKEKSTDEDN